MNRGLIVAWGATAGRWLRPHRLLVAPRVRLLSASGDQAIVAVDGLVCSACAARTRSALCGVPGVEDVTVDLATGRAEVSLREGYPAPDAAALQRAVDRVVVARLARGWIEWLARRHREQPEHIEGTPADGDERRTA